MKKEILRMERVTYKEHEVTKLEDFNLNLFEGEIRGLLPVNAFGLTTFLSLLKTNLPLYDGYVYYCEYLVNSWKRTQVTYNRITVIQSKMSLVEGLTVVENIFVLRQGFRQEHINRRILRRQLQPFLNEIDVRIDAMTYVGRLSVFERLTVELIKGVVAGHRLIVVNEVETLISGQELWKFRQMVGYYASKGIAFLWISVHLEDMLYLCEHVALLANGRIEKTLRVGDQQAEYIEILTREYDTLIRRYYERKKVAIPVNQELYEITYGFRSAEQLITFTIQPGECLVVQSLAHKIDIATQLTKEAVDVRGGVMINGKQVDIYKSREVAVIWERPTYSMLFKELDYIENLCFNIDPKLYRLWNGHAIRKSIRKEYSQMIGEEVFDTSVDTLTQKQKYQLIYERILLQKPKVVFCVQPFSGADLEHRMYIWHLLERFLTSGISVVIIAVNLADSLAIADRLICMDENAGVTEYRKGEFSKLPSGTPWKHLHEMIERQWHAT